MSGRSSDAVVQGCLALVMRVMQVSKAWTLKVSLTPLDILSLKSVHKGDLKWS